MPRYASRERQEAEEARHREEILEAAVRVFATHGFHASTIRDVARAAAFSVGKLYLHFPSKQALYEALLERYGDGLVETAEESMRGTGRAAEKIEAAVRRALAFLERNPLLPRLFVNETLGFELRLETQFGKTFAGKYEHMLSRARRVFDEGLEAREFCGATAEELTLKLAGIINAVVAAEARHPKRRTPGELAEVILRLFYESPRSARGERGEDARMRRKCSPRR